MSATDSGTSFSDSSELAAEFALSAIDESGTRMGDEEAILESIRSVEPPSESLSLSLHPPPIEDEGEEDSEVDDVALQNPPFPVSMAS